MRIIDISISVSKSTILWPGSSIPKLKRFKDMKRGDGHNESLFEMNVHTGTHIDAPLHFISSGKSIDQVNLEVFVGSAYVAYLPRAKDITAKDLENMRWRSGTKRLLLKTSNSSLWNKKNPKFKKDYVGLTPDAAKWIVKKGIKLIGIDYLSIAKFSDAQKVHQILLGAGVFILEGIDLSKVKKGKYELICLPLKLLDAEATPVRAVLLTTQA